LYLNSYYLIYYSTYCKISLWGCLLIPLFLHSQAVDTLYFEDFQQGIPSDFQILDQDSLTAEEQVNFVSDAWVGATGDVLEGILSLQAEDQVSVSTSFYVENQTAENPLAADDWMILPPISIPDSGIYLLTWKAGTPLSNFADGYEVRVSTSGSQISRFDEVLFATEAADPFLATLSTSLEGYQGQLIHIAFRNNSIDKFLLVLDDIAVLNAEQAILSDIDLIDIDLPDTYTYIPKGQAISLDLDFTIVNKGSTILSDVEGSTDVRHNGERIFVQSESLTRPVFPRDTVSFDIFPSFVPQDTGLYEINYAVFIPEKEIDTTNNQATYRGFALTDTTFARDLEWQQRDFDDATGFEGSPGDQIVIAGLFDLRRPDVITSASALFFFPDGQNIGDSLYFSVFTVQDATPIEIARTSTYVISEQDTSSSEGTWITLPFDNGGVSLDAELFYLGIQQRGDAPLLVTYTDELYQPFTSWIRSNQLPDDGWTPIEFFDDGDGNPLRFTWVIRAHVKGCGTLSADLQLQNDLGQPADTIRLIVSGGLPPYDFQWRTLSGILIDTLNTQLSDLSPGMYTIEVRDQQACKLVLPFEVSGIVNKKNLLSPPFLYIAVYPTIIDRQFTLEMRLDHPQSTFLNLMDMQGRQVWQTSLSQLSHMRQSIHIPAHLTGGSYWLRIETLSGKYHSQLVFIR